MPQNDALDDGSVTGDDSNREYVTTSSPEQALSEEEVVKTKLSLPTYILVCLFGIGSWLAINGIWMELPILVNHAPEKWSLPSYLTVITELANIGPLAYSFGNKLFPRAVHERTAVYAMITFGSVACVLLAFFWDKTSYVLGAERSTALICLSFFVALVDCTSTVVFLPFMAIFPPIYMSALFTGENMSSLLPSFFALMQGIDKQETITHHVCANQTCHNTTSTIFTGLKFSPDYFFILLALMMLTCGAAFLAINFLPFVKKFHVMDYKSVCQLSTSGANKPRPQNRDVSREPLLDNVSLQTLAGGARTGIMDGTFCKTNGTFLFLLFLQAWINCISNGVISQIQAFACEPYGPSTYHLGKIKVMISYF